MGSDEAREVVLEKHEADHVLEELRLGIALEPLLAQERAHARDRFVPIPRFAQDRGGGVGVEVHQPGAPRLVALRRARVRVARDLPPADVLAAGREADDLRCFRSEALEHLAHALRVQELARLRDAGRIRLAVRVRRVGGVEALDRGAEAVGRRGHGADRRLLGRAQHTPHRAERELVRKPEERVAGVAALHERARLRERVPRVAARSRVRRQRVELVVGRARELAEFRRELAGDLGRHAAALGAGADLVRGGGNGGEVVAREALGHPLERDEKIAHLAEHVIALLEREGHDDPVPPDFGSGDGAAGGG